MDNRRFDIAGEGDEALELALRYALMAVPGNRITHFRLEKLSPKVKYYGNPTLGHNVEETIDEDQGTKTMILYWHRDTDTYDMPTPGHPEDIVCGVKAWLQKVDYGEEPDHDGFNTKGWRIFNEGWGHILGSPYASVAIQPLWAMHGK